MGYTHSSPTDLTKGNLIAATNEVATGNLVQPVVDTSASSTPTRQAVSWTIPSGEPTTQSFNDMIKKFHQNEALRTTTSTRTTSTPTSSIYNSPTSTGRYSSPTVGLDPYTIYNPSSTTTRTTSTPTVVPKTTISPPKRRHHKRSRSPKTKVNTVSPTLTQPVTAVNTSSIYNSPYVDSSEAHLDPREAEQAKMYEQEAAKGTISVPKTSVNDDLVSH